MKEARRAQQARRGGPLPPPRNAALDHKQRERTEPANGFNGENSSGEEQDQNSQQREQKEIAKN